MQESLLKRCFANSSSTNPQQEHHYRSVPFMHEARFMATHLVYNYRHFFRHVGQKLPLGTCGSPLLTSFALLLISLRFISCFRISHICL